MHPTDALSVPCNDLDLDAVIQYCRWAGYSEDNVKKTRDKTLPKGIWRRTGCETFLVAKRDGNKRSIRTASSLSDAQALQHGETCEGVSRAAESFDSNLDNDESDITQS